MEPVTIRIGHEELALLLETLGIERLGGTPVEAFETMTPDQAQLVRSTVQHSLLARQMLLPISDGSIAVNGDIQRLLRLCAYPDAVLVIVSRMGDDLPRQLEAYYRLGEVAIRHYLPYDGVHDFTFLAEHPDLVPAIVERLSQNTAAKANPQLSLTLPVDLMETAQANANSGLVETVATQLVEAGVPEQIASPLASVLASPTVRLRVSLLSPHRNAQPEPLTLLCDAQRCWHLTPVDGSRPATRLETVDLEFITSELQRTMDSWNTLGTGQVADDGRGVSI